MTVLTGLWRYLKEVSGESRWDDYLAECAAHGHAPVSRREFERRRDARQVQRCC